MPELIPVREYTTKDGKTVKVTCEHSGSSVLFKAVSSYQWVQPTTEAAEVQLSFGRPIQGYGLYGLTEQRPMAGGGLQWIYEWHCQRSCD